VPGAVVVHSTNYPTADNRMATSSGGANLTPINPTIAAALVAVGGSGLIAIASFLTTRSMVVRQLVAARQSRPWDKQAAAYTDAITAIRWQQARRLRELLVIERGGSLLPEEKPPVDWGELQGRLFAFASPGVLVALKAASDAGIQAEGFRLEVSGLIRKADIMGEHWERETDTTDQIERVIVTARQAVQAANDKDDALIDVIRADLPVSTGGRLRS
jgi:hypothetical protein